jgi:hypothetical protein
MQTQPGLLVVQKMMRGIGAAVAVNGRYVAVIAADAEHLKEAYERLHPGEDFRLAHTDQVGYVRLDMAYPLTGVEMQPLVEDPHEHCSLARWFEEEGWDQLQPKLPLELEAKGMVDELIAGYGEAMDPARESLADWWQRWGRHTCRPNHG